MSQSKLYDVIVYGQSIAALVATRELAKTKVNAMMVAPNAFLGGHFNGLQFWGHDFDVGMNFFEFTSYRANTGASLSTFNLSDKSDSGRFVEHVKNYIEDALDIECHKVTDIQTVWNHIWLEDFLIADHFESLARLPADIKSKILSEIQKTSESSMNMVMHPSKKNSSQLFLEKSFGEVSKAALGATFHNTFIEPFCQKIANTSSDDVIARYHRLTWMPLIYPETLRAGLMGEPLRLPTIEFHYPKSGSMRVLCKKLTADLQKSQLIHTGTIQTVAVPSRRQGFSKSNAPTDLARSKSIASLKGADGLYEVALSNGETLFCKHLIWAHDLESLNAALAPTNVNLNVTPYQKASVGCCFLIARREDLLQNFSTAFFANVDQPIYRVTNFDHCAGMHHSPSVRLCAEYNLAQAQSLGDTSHFIQTLKQLKVLRENAVIENSMTREFKNSLLLPSFDNYRLFTENDKTYSDLITQIETALGAPAAIYRLGACSSFTSSSLNEQIIQALQMTSQLQQQMNESNL